jgi:hypothetical protein
MSRIFTRKEQEKDFKNNAFLSSCVVIVIIMSAQPDVVY